MTIRRATYDDVLDQCRRVAEQGRRLRPGEFPIAAFDADGTLWGPDVAELLWDHLIAERALSDAATAPLARAVRSIGLEPAHDPYDDYHTLDRQWRSGKCDEAVMVEVMLRGLAGLSIEDVYEHSVRALAASADLRSLEKGRAASMIARLRDEGYRVIVVSASPKWTIEIAVKAFGIEPADVIAGGVPVVDSILTDGVITPVPFREGKIQAILRRFGTVPRIAAGNTVSDFPMLAASSHIKLLVNPTSDLVTTCDEVGGNGWAMGIVDLLKRVPAKTTKRVSARPAAAHTRAIGSATTGRMRAIRTDH